VKQGKQLNTLRMYNETKDGKMKSWLINQTTSRGDITTMTGPARVENGPVRARIESDFTWGNSRFKVRTYIYRSLPRIDYEVVARWLEYGTDEKDSPMLRAVFPIDVPNSTFWNDVAFNVVERPHDGMLAGKPTPEWLQNREDPATVERADGQEVPAQKWVDVTDGKGGFALLNRSKYGHCYDKDELRLTLLRSAGNPDEFPNMGKFTIQYAIMPHTGDWTNGVMQAGLDYNLPVYASEPLSTSLEKKQARMPAEQQLVSIDQPNVLLSTLKKAEDSNELIVRLCEMTGRETSVRLSLPYRVKSARRVTLLELPMDGVARPQWEGQDVTVALKPHEIATLSLQLK
jgi:alpha-mannosidase